MKCKNNKFRVVLATWQLTPYLIMSLLVEAGDAIVAGIDGGFVR
jgi:hypothetical protein